MKWCYIWSIINLSSHILIPITHGQKESTKHKVLMDDDEKKNYSKFDGRKSFSFLGTNSDLFTRRVSATTIRNRKIGRHLNKKESSSPFVFSEEEYRQRRAEIDQFALITRFFDEDELKYLITSTERDLLQLQQQHQQREERDLQKSPLCPLNDAFYIQGFISNTFFANSLSLSKGGDRVTVGSYRCYHSGSVRSYELNTEWGVWEKDGDFIKITGDVFMSSDGDTKVISYYNNDGVEDEWWSFIAPFLGEAYCADLDSTFSENITHIYSYDEETCWKEQNYSREFELKNAIAVSGNGEVIGLISKDSESDKDLLEILRFDGSGWVPMIGESSSPFVNYSTQKIAFSYDGTKFVLLDNEEYLARVFYFDYYAVNDDTMLVEEQAWKQIGNAFGNNTFDIRKDETQIDMSSDGTHLAFSYYESDATVSTNGIVEVYQLNEEGTDFIQLGETIDTENNLIGGNPHSMALSPDGQFVAIGFKGTGKVFQYNNETAEEEKKWIKLGDTVIVDQDAQDKDRTLVDIAQSEINGLRIVLSSRNFAARVHTYNQEKEEWCQVGCDITWYTGLPPFVPIITTAVLAIFGGLAIAIIATAIAVVAIILLVVIVILIPLSPILILLFLLFLPVLGPLAIILTIVLGIVGVSVGALVTIFVAVVSFIILSLATSINVFCAVSCNGVITQSCTFEQLDAWVNGLLEGSTDSCETEDDTNNDFDHSFFLTSPSTSPSIGPSSIVF